MSPFYRDEFVTIYCCDYAVAPVDVSVFGAVVTDPPYGETSYKWDRWPHGWPGWLLPRLGRSASLWCFGSLRLFMDRRDEFAGWQLAQDIVWEKNNGSSMACDRFRRVHEMAAHFYSQRGGVGGCVSGHDPTAGGRAAGPRWRGPSADDAGALEWNLAIELPIQRHAARALRHQSARCPARRRARHAQADLDTPRPHHLLVRAGSPGAGSLLRQRQHARRRQGARPSRGRHRLRSEGMPRGGATRGTMFAAKLAGGLVGLHLPAALARLAVL